MPVMSSVMKQEIHELIETLSDEELSSARDYIKAIRGNDPFANIDPKEKAKLDAVLEERLDRARAGETRPFREVIDELRAAR